MPIERLDPDCVVVLGGNDEDVRRHIESDFRIRSGLCPNGHGLMALAGWGQQCGECGFTCNTLPEKDTPQ